MLLLGAGLLFLGGVNLVDFAGQLFVSGQEFAEFDESAGDENVHLHGTPAFKHRGQHGHAVLGEGIG